MKNVDEVYFRSGANLLCVYDVTVFLFIYHRFHEFSDGKF